MRRYWEIDQTFAQPSESLLKKNLKESVKKQKEKGNKLEPVVISGRTIAKSWWGKAWCDNLERYADFASRGNQKNSLPCGNPYQPAHREKV